MEALRAELARAKEQARISNAAALKAAEELKAKKAAHCESQEKMAKMVVELKDTADRCRVLEKENRAKATDLEKATVADKDTRSAMRAKEEELREAGVLRLGNPSCYGGSSEIHGMPLWIGCGVRQMRIWIWRRVLSMFQSVCFH